MLDSYNRSAGDVFLYGVYVLVRCNERCQGSIFRLLKMDSAKIKLTHFYAIYPHTLRFPDRLVYFDRIAYAVSRFFRTSI